MLPQFYFDDPIRWPKRPYCTDDLENGLRIRPLAVAKEKAYIQHNPPHLQSSLIFDLDFAGAAHAWEDANLPEPTWTTINPRNGHAHLVYGLQTPVLLAGDGVRAAPLRYVAVIESMMRIRLKADCGYSGLITKNPAHPRWHTLNSGHLYDLNYLAEYLPGIEKFQNRKQKIEDIGLGRNVTLFDSLRHWAYRNRRHFKELSMWQSACNTRAIEMNTSFMQPLHGMEVLHVAKSISKWTWQKFDAESSDERFRKLQAHRGALGGRPATTGNTKPWEAAGISRATWYRQTIPK